MVAKLRYLLWSAAHLLGADRSCLGCGNTQTYLIKRKYTTALYGCASCKLMFRVPKDRPGTDQAFYDSEYKQGFTTDCPTPQALEALKSTRFADTEKDYRAYISVLEATAVFPTTSILVCCLG